MSFRFEAACGCDTGKVRMNNEDNLCFAGECLEPENNGLQEILFAEGRITTNVCGAIFDGMGGENFGEEASAAAAFGFLKKTALWWIACLTGKPGYLKNLVLSLNDTVVAKKRRLHTNRMGTTMVAILLGRRYAYFCNIGDSRAYLFREGKLTQLSQDHVEVIPGRIKTPLTQHLGIEPEYMQVEPYITKQKMQTGDRYLLCSDGLTDMLTDPEIADILEQNEGTRAGVRTLIDSALERGGRDNISVILYRVQ